MSPKEKKRERKKKRKKHKSNRKYEEIHELSYYLDDRLKLMKEVVHIMKPRKIKSMAPEFLKNVKFDDLMFLLMDELLGISKKRLKYIFSGKSDDIASSSCTDSEEEEQQKLKVKQSKFTDDVISLSDITSDDDDLLFCDEDKVQDYPALSDVKSIKKEKGRKIRKTSRKQEKLSGNETTEKDKLMSVLELLELQARARAIRSQLDLETKVEKKEDSKINEPETKEDSDPEAVVIQSPKKDEIVISSSDSENEEENRKRQKTEETSEHGSGNPKSWETVATSSIIQNSIICGNRKTQKLKIIRDRTVVGASESNSVVKQSGILENKTDESEEINAVLSECNQQKEAAITKIPADTKIDDNSFREESSDVSKRRIERTNSCSDHEPDVIVINLDESDDLQCEDT